MVDKDVFYEFGPYLLDPVSRVLTREGEFVPLTPKVVETLLVLVRKAGQPVSKEELLQTVWPDTFVQESNLAQNISVLRKALGQAPGGGPYVATLAKRGYRFVPEVRTRPLAGKPVTQPDAIGESPEVHSIAGENIETTLHPGERATGPVSPKKRKIAAATLIAILGGMAALWYEGRRVAGAPAGADAIHSLAVLPLQNLSGDPQQDYFVDGMTELLTQEVSRALPVRVTSRTSAMHYKKMDERLPAIARELNVDAVIEGSAARSGNRLRVTVQLIAARTDRHLWAETYDRNLVDALTLQIEIARTIAHELGAAGVAGAALHAATVNPDAFEAGLRARYYLDQRTGPEINKAISWFQKAIEADPAYAPAYAGLADCYNQLGTVMVGARSPADSRTLAMAAAKRALEIDPNLAEAHAAFAYDNLYDWNWAVARQEFERALALNPNYAPAHLWFAHYLTARGEFDRGQQEVRLAADLDPLSPIIQTQIAWLLGHAGRYREAIAQYRKVLAANPRYQWALWQLGSILSESGDHAAAIETLEKAVQIGRTPAIVGTLAQAYARAGRRGQAEKLLQELFARSRENYVPPHAFVHVYLGFGDRDKVFEWLEKSYQERSNSLIWMADGRLFDPVRSDPRFDMYLRRVGLK